MYEKAQIAAVTQAQAVDRLYGKVNIAVATHEKGKEKLTKLVDKASKSYKALEQQARNDAQAIPLDKRVVRNDRGFMYPAIKETLIEAMP